MDKNRTKGPAKQILRVVKETASKFVGGPKPTAEGQAGKATGEIRDTLGGAKDTSKS